MMNEVRIGLLGLGTVGAGVVKVLDAQRATLEERAGCRLRLGAIADVDVTRRREGLDLAQLPMTTDAARFTHDQTGNVLSLETNLFNLVGADLRAKGHAVRAVTGGSVGGYQGILFVRDPSLPEPSFDRRSITEDLPVNGVYRAGSDHRKDGQAVGW